MKFRVDDVLIAAYILIHTWIHMHDHFIDGCKYNISTCSYCLISPPHCGYLCLPSMCVDKANEEIKKDSRKAKATICSKTCYKKEIRAQQSVFCISIL